MKAAVAALAVAAIAVVLFACATSPGASGSTGGAQQPATQAASATAQDQQSQGASEAKPQGAQGLGTQSAQAGPQQEASREASPNESDESALDTAELQGGGEAEAGVVLVKIADGVTAEQLGERVAALDFVAGVSTESVADGYIKLELAEGVEVEEALDLLAGEDFAADSQPNYVYHLLDNGAGGTANGSLRAEAANLKAFDMNVDDPYFDKQWGLEAVKALDAWNLVKADRKVTIAILDSGVAENHEDLEANIVDRHSYWASNKNVDDWYGHGTHVAGIASAVTNNAAGVAGASYNANLMIVQVLNSEGTATTASMVDGLKYVVDHAKEHNVRIVNLSLGGRSDTPDTAIDNALKLAHEAGLLIVDAAGNGHTDEWYYPVDFDSRAIGVIGTTKSGDTFVRGSYSNYNDTRLKTKDLSAPGSGIYSTSEEGDYRYDSGTSMATAFVSGVAALVFAANPDLTALQVKQLLRESATDIARKGWDVDTGYGMVNALAAVNAALSGEVPESAKASIADAKIALAEQDESYFVYNGKAKKPKITVELGGKTLVKGIDYTVQYRNNTNAGSATIMVVGKGSYEGIATKVFKVTKAPIANVTLKRIVYTFNGKAKKPGVVVTDSNGVELEKNVDYTVAYENNVNAGKARVVVEGKGNYKGTKKPRFIIKRAKVKSISLKKTAVVYTGKKLKPSVVVLGVKNGVAGKKLKKNVDYKVVYRKNLNAGKAKVIVKGVGNYTGIKTAAFLIKKRKLSSITLKNATYDYTGAKISPKVRVRGMKAGKANRLLVKGIDYKVVAAKGRTNPGTYTYKAIGRGNYRGTVKATLTIRRAPLSSIRLTKSVYTENGKARSPKAIVRGAKNGKAKQKLVEGVDYRLVTPAGRTRPGTYTYKAVGKGNYRGTVTTTLTIDKSTAILNGIDIASWQSDLIVSAVPADFVIVKATGGNGYVNPYFHTQADATLKSGKLLGLYHYAREVGYEGSAKAEADYFVKTARQYLGKAILVLDWEQDLSLGTGWAKVFLDRVYARTGVKPLIYTSKSTTRSYNWANVARKYRLWGAQYPDYKETGFLELPWTDEYGWGAWTNGPTIFQYASTGVLDGYDGHLDLNLFYGSAALWRTLSRK